ncbi:MAG: putative amicyanin protein [Sphingomonas bacterium]|uniref:cupredoxin domain-containing protein n=1 Tax=Sphingomonas bacterium TaxID=1895847 RepID=UPI0026274539|nr:cupredoxin domain-containing protein [Sphingomonas bacterium]MDB5712083.1 putative amicyanin protein [Sphingomonas bacterium]
MKMTFKHAARQAAFAVTATASLGLAGAAPAAPAAQTYTITMANMSYGSVPSGVKVGDTILWVNRDTVLHTATARDHSFDLRIAPGKTAKLVVQKPGSIAFYCILHAAMRGTLTVAP